MILARKSVSCSWFSLVWVRIGNATQTKVVPADIMSLCPVEDWSSGEIFLYEKKPQIKLLWMHQLYFRKYIKMKARMKWNIRHFLGHYASSQCFDAVALKNIVFYPWSWCTFCNLTFYFSKEPVFICDLIYCSTLLNAKKWVGQKIIEG